MAGNGSPDDADLHWPVARGELDDLATLELGRDECGRLSWQNMTPPGPDSFKTWLPRREHAPALEHGAHVAGDDPFGSLFPSESTSRAGTAPVQSVDTSRVSPLPAIPFWSAGAAAPLRLSLALPPSETRHPVRVALPPAATQSRTRTEQLALLGSGALIGIMATVIVGVAWIWETRGAPAARRSAEARTAVSSAPAFIPVAPLPVGLVPLAKPVVPGVDLASTIVPIASPAATVITTPPTSNPVHAATTDAAPRPAVAPPRAARASAATAPTTRAAAAPVAIAAPPEALATVGRFAAAYSRMDANATHAVWPAADRQTLVTTFTALREQRLTLSGCRGTMQEAAATVMCQGTLRYRPRVGNHDTRTVEGPWRFTVVQRDSEWVVGHVESP